MAYTIHKTCSACGRRYSYRSDDEILDVCMRCMTHCAECEQPWDAHDFESCDEFGNYLCP